MRHYDLVTGQQYLACTRYSFLRYAAFGRVSIAAAHWEERPAGARRNWSQDYLKNCRAEYDRIRDDKGLTELGLTLFDDVVLFENPPSWLRPHIPNKRDVRDAALLMATIDRITQILGY